MTMDKPVPRRPPGIPPTAEPSPYASGYPGPYMGQYHMPPPLQNGQDSFYDSSGSFKDYLDIILRRRVAVIMIFAMSVIISVAYVFIATPLYVSTTRLEIKGKSDKLAADDSTADNYMSTQIEILKSRSLAEAVVNEMEPAGGINGPENLGLLQVPLNLWGTIVDLFKDESQLKTEEEENAEQLSVTNPLVYRLDAKLVKGSNLIEVLLTAPSPQLANELLTKFVKTYLERNLEKRRHESIESGLWLRTEAGKIQSKLRESESKLLDFSVKHGLVVATEGALGQVMGLLNRRVEGQMRSEEKRLRAHVLKDSKTATSSTVPNQPDQSYLNRLKEDMSNAEAEYVAMKGIYSPTYPKMVLAGRKIAFLKDRITEVERDFVAGAVEFSEKEEKAFKENVDSSKLEVTRVKGLEAEYSILKKDVDSNAEFLKIITKEIQDTDIKSSTISNNMVVIDPPTIPTSPSFPKKRLVLMIGLFAGLVGGVVCAFIWEHLDDTLQNPDHLTSSLHVRRLGVVPDIEKTGNHSEEELAQGVIEFLAYYHPKTPISDAIRNLQMSILFSNPEYEIKCLAISSSLPSEGKTFLAVSFASVLCSADNKRIVVVDLDMRKPRIHSVFGVPGSTPGISNVLNGNGDGFLLSDVIHSHTIPGLYYITAGPVPSDSVGLLHSLKLRDVVKELRETFDFIVIDCPPILGFPDTPMLSRYTDGLVLVARQGYVGKNEIAEAIDQVSSVDGANVLGVVFNRAYVPALYGYGYKYGYRYGGHYSQQSYKYYQNT